ncbi:flavin reductase family protein [Streptomyces sp. NRRL WC-3742]|uniref:flavin reductase family protein n=1 Tax=Streptomyces sp. NRRL WC-3742 TaxID=1463934 RepID=UPI0004C9896E|nr:flavin reductase family protein [Streptomyces sp. NRRL WC-3742]
MKLTLARTGTAEPDPQDCLDLYRRLAGPVTVVTTCGPDGEPLGLTASAVTTVSLRPPMLLACLSGGSGTLAALRTRRTFAVHLLRSGQEALATTFAGPGGSGKFARVVFGWELGVPVLDGTLGRAVCTLVEERVYGDHSVVVGRVVSVRAGDSPDDGPSPLLWVDRRFRALAGTEGGFGA